MSTPKNPLRVMPEYLRRDTERDNVPVRMTVSETRRAEASVYLESTPMIPAHLPPLPTGTHEPAWVPTTRPSRMTSPDEFLRSSTTGKLVVERVRSAGTSPERTQMDLSTIRALHATSIRLPAPSRRSNSLLNRALRAAEIQSATGPPPEKDTLAHAHRLIHRRIITAVGASDSLGTPGGATEVGGDLNPIFPNLLVVPASDHMPARNADEIRCVCATPRLDDGGFMVACDACGVWFHGACVGVDEIRVRGGHAWMCPRCAGPGGPSPSSKP
jgi:hypothetical protein